VAEIVQEISSSEYAIDDNLSRFVWMPGNSDASAFYSEVSAGAVRTGFKVFVLHSMSMVARRLPKVKYFKDVGNFERLVIAKD